MPFSLGALNNLGTLRFALAIIVLGGHTPHYPETWPDLGGIAVSVFFFVSGFLMPLAFETNYRCPKFSEQTFRFWLNRFLKIYPWYWLSILFPLLLVIFRGPRNDWETSFFYPTILLQNVLLLGLNQEHFWGHYIKYNNPAWSLDVELQYYLLVPALVWAYEKWPRMLIYLIVLAGLPSLYLMARPIGNIGLDRSLLGWSALFFAGFLYYQMVSKASARTWTCGISDLNGASVAVFLGCMLCFEPTRIPAIVIALFLAAAHLLKLELAGAKGKAGKILGDLSYPVYIFHFFLIGPVQARSTPIFERAGLSGTVLYLAILIVNCAVCVIFCAVVVKFGDPLIERVRSRLRIKKQPST